LDTNRDGNFDDKDDPYSPFYPGDEYVDWVGTSIYHYGTNWPWIDNVVPQADSFESKLNYGNFYSTYAVTRNKPVAIAETGATYHVRMLSSGATIDQGPGALAIKQAWWRQSITSKSLLDKYPKVKLFCLFEFAKNEELTFRDFRIAHDNSILNAFREDFKGVANRYYFGNGTGRIFTPSIVTGSNGALHSDFIAFIMLALVYILIQ